MGGQRVNFLVDGIRVGEVYVGYGRDLVDTSLLKRVEILKGPSSALYGSDGLAGVVSYLTKDASDLAEIGQNYFELSGGIDSDNFQKNIGARSCCWRDFRSNISIHESDHERNESS